MTSREKRHFLDALRRDGPQKDMDPFEHGLCNELNTCSDALEGLREDYEEAVDHAKGLQSKVQQLTMRLETAKLILVQNEEKRREGSGT